MHFINAIGIPLAEGYGLTETSGGVTVYDKHHLKLQSVGKILPHIQIKIADDGEILVSGKTIMQGYYKDEIATNNALKQGWFHTGDIGHIDEQGFLYITDRKKSLFKLSTGKYIAPTPIEQQLELHSIIEQAVIFGEGEKQPQALLIVAAKYHHHNMIDLTTMIDKILETVNQKLAPWEKITDYHLSKTALSIENHYLTPTLKKKRQDILKNFIKNHVLSMNDSEQPLRLFAEATAQKPLKEHLED